MLSIDTIARVAVNVVRTAAQPAEHKETHPVRRGAVAVPPAVVVRRER